MKLISVFNLTRKSENTNYFHTLKILILACTLCELIIHNLINKRWHEIYQEYLFYASFGTVV